MGQLDLSLFQYLNSFAGKSQYVNSIIVFLADYSSYLIVALFLLFVLRTQKKVRILIEGFVSVFIARGILTEIIRHFYHRPRPFSAMHVSQLIRESNWSFPSGHAAFFFALATSVYFHNKRWGIGLFIASLILTISRVIAGVHYPSDILGGMIIGIAIGYGVFLVSKKFLSRG